MRRAQITTNRDRADTVSAYLPSNYHVESIEDGEPEGIVVVTIAGEDRHGWTLDDYVLPRLASGLLWGEEVPS